MALGLALGGCGDDGTESETMLTPVYGVPETSDSETATGGETDDTASSSSSSESSSGSDSGSDSGSTSSGGDTDTDTGSTTLEPDYGVPTTSG